jgi:hypothetical protein
MLARTVVKGIAAESSKGGDCGTGWRVIDGVREVEEGKS